MATRRTKRTIPAGSSTYDWVPLFLSALARHGNISQACSVADVSRSNVYHRRDMDADFNRGMADAFEDFADGLEKMAATRAKKSDKLLMYLLTARRYKNTLRVEGGLTLAVVEELVDASGHEGDPPAPGAAGVPPQ